MSRLNTPGTITLRPSPNIYTLLAFISMAATLGALAFAAYRFHDVGLL